MDFTAGLQYLPISGGDALNFRRRCTKFPAAFPEFPAKFPASAAGNAAGNFAGNAGNFRQHFRHAGNISGGRRPNFRRRPPPVSEDTAGLGTPVVPFAYDAAGTPLTLL